MIFNLQYVYSYNTVPYFSLTQFFVPERVESNVQHLPTYLPVTLGATMASFFTVRSDSRLPSLVYLLMKPPLPSEREKMVIWRLCYGKMRQFLSRVTMLGICITAPSTGKARGERCSSLESLQESPLDNVVKSCKEKCSFESREWLSSSATRSDICQLPWWQWLVDVFTLTPSLEEKGEGKHQLSISTWRARNGRDILMAATSKSAPYVMKFMCYILLKLENANLYEWYGMTADNGLLLNCFLENAMFESRESGATIAARKGRIDKTYRIPFKDYNWCKMTLSWYLTIKDLPEFLFGVIDRLWSAVSFCAVRLYWGLEVITCSSTTRRQRNRVSVCDM